ncbi:MAG TPA: DUF1835 domain-containing protein [Geminicoccaceae bacterium]|nr:DUF1835 domain-containing protein [Geminicoccaceae bacterium]
MAACLHVTNGDSAAAPIAGLVAPEPVLPWRDMLHDGPVRAGLGLDALSAERARFLAGCFGLDPEAALAEFRARDARLRAAIAEGASFVLWFEHDLYDQLQLVQVLSVLVEAGVPRARVALVQADDHLGRMPPDALARLAREELTDGQLEAALDAWAAFRAPTPEPLALLLQVEPVGLRWLVPAVARLLEELPAPGTGLSRTERRIAELLAEQPRATGKLFEAASAAEPARFLGDWPFFLRLDALAAGPRPLVDGLPPGGFPYTGPEADRRAYLGATAKLTPAGGDVLAGRLDRATALPIDRWLGGTHLRPDHLWRWDATARALSLG